jgi:transcriptional antiterminator NusG
MVLDEDSWYVVRNTPGVTGFVGSGNKPTPLRPEEVDKILKRMEAEAPKIKVSFKVGEKVRIVEGPFEDFMGTVDEIDLDRARVRVLVNFFGRETPIELDFLQVERA